jgi:6,7-dimethyl-8-ribityllumazine synthase
MVKTHKGQHAAQDLHFAIVVSRFNSAVTQQLLQGALRALRECGARNDHIEVVEVPGAFELPLFASALASGGRFNALICLGAIVRGETWHHEYLAHAVFGALEQVMLSGHVPISLGVLTTENIEQALQRAGDDPGNKGFEAAMTAVETANLLRELER